MVNTSLTVASAALMVNVSNKAFVGSIVTMLPDRVTPVGTAEPKFPPFRLYVQFEIVVFTAVPFTAKLEAGVILPSLSTVIA